MMVVFITPSVSRCDWHLLKYQHIASVWTFRLLAMDSSDPAPHRRLPSRHRFFADLSQCLFDFVIELLPTGEEMAVKENVRKLLERLIRTIEPDSRLLSFGSTANGFSLRNSGLLAQLCWPLCRS
jgi:hypothetical protein